MAKGMLKILQHLLNDFHRLFDHFVGTRHSEQTGDTNTSRKRDWNCLELKDSIKKLLFSLMTLTIPIFRTWHIFLIWRIVIVYKEINKMVVITNKDRIMNFLCVIHKCYSICIVGMANKNVLRFHVCYYKK